MRESFDAEGREKNQEEMEEFAEVIIGPDWREKASRRELVDFWVWWKGEDWKSHIEFLRRMWSTQKTEEAIPESELRVLGECIEPTEELYNSYRMFQERLCRVLDEENAELGAPPSRGVPSYYEFVVMVEDWKTHNPMRLYGMAQMWQMGFDEYLQKARDSVTRDCERLFADYENRKK